MAIFKDIDPRGFLLNDNDTGVDHLGESTYADAIAQSVHHADSPITIGLFAKWGSGKSFLLRHIESILKRYQRQSEIDNVKTERREKCECRKSCILWGFWIFLVVLLIILTFLLAIKPKIFPQIFGIGTKFRTEIVISANETSVPASESTPSPMKPLDEYTKYARIVGMVLLPIELFVVIILGCCGNSWLSVNYYGSCRLLTYGAFTKLPVRNPRDDIVEDPGLHSEQVLKHIRPSDARLAMAATEAENFSRKYIFVDFKAWEYAGSDTLWAGIVTNITDAIEAEFGVITARTFRMLTIEEIPRNVLCYGTRTIFIEASNDCDESEVLDMIRQYGVVEEWKKIEPTKKGGVTYWRFRYSSDGECRSAIECLAIEGVICTEDDPTMSCSLEDKKLQSSGFFRGYSNRESKKKLLRNGNDTELKKFKHGKAVVELDQDALDYLKLPTKSFCCNRFCSHFVKYPTKLLCLPRLVWWILILLCGICIPIIANVIANHFDLDLYRTYRTVPLAGQIMLWLPAGIAVSTFACKFIWAMCHSQRKRINKALDGTKTKMAEELGFMNKVKNEIEVVSKLVQCARFTHQKDYKIVIAIDDLDRIPLNKIQSVLEAVHILLSDKSSPFICFIAIDPRIVSKCIEDGMGEIIRESRITGHEYLKKIINLPICLPQISDSCKKRFLAGLIDQADHTITYRKGQESKSTYSTIHEGESTTSVDFVPRIKYEARPASEGLDAVANRNKKLSSNSRTGTDFIGKVTQVNHPFPSKNVAGTSQNTVKRRKRSPKKLDHKDFLFHCRKYIYENDKLHEHMHGNPRNMKRLFNVISLTASIVNCFFKKQRRRHFIQCHLVGNEDHGMLNKDAEIIERTDEFAENLVQWVVLADQWPYRTSYILQVIEDAEQRQGAGLDSEGIPNGWTIFEIFQKKVKDECEQGDPALLSLDADPDLFYSYIRLLGENDFTARRIQRLQKYTVNLDFSIQHSISFRRDLSCLNTNVEDKTPSPENTAKQELSDAEAAKSPETIVENTHNSRALQAPNGHVDTKRYSLPILVHSAQLEQT